jgi:hypothetical protein
MYLAGFFYPQLLTILLDPKLNQRQPENKHFYGFLIFDGYALIFVLNLIISVHFLRQNFRPYKNYAPYFVANQPQNLSNPETSHACRGKNLFVCEPDVFAFLGHS